MLNRFVRTKQPDQELLKLTLNNSGIMVFLKSALNVFFVWEFSKFREIRELYNIFNFQTNAHNPFTIQRLTEISSVIY